MVNSAPPAPAAKQSREATACGCKVKEGARPPGKGISCESVRFSSRAYRDRGKPRGEGERRPARCMPQAMTAEAFFEQHGCRGKTIVFRATLLRNSSNERRNHCGLLGLVRDGASETSPASTLHVHGRQGEPHLLLPHGRARSASVLTRHFLLLCCKTRCKRADPCAFDNPTEGDSFDTWLLLFANFLLCLPSPAHALLLHCAVEAPPHRRWPRPPTMSTSLSQGGYPLLNGSHSNQTPPRSRVTR